MKLKNNILYPVEGNLVTTLLPDDKLILKCLFPNPKKTEQLGKETQHHLPLPTPTLLIPMLPSSQGGLKFIYIIPYPQIRPQIRLITGPFCGTQANGWAKQMDLTLRQDSKNTVANSLLATTYLGPKMDLEVRPVVFECCSYSYLPHEKIINSVTM